MVHVKLENEYTLFHANVKIFFHGVFDYPLTDPKQAGSFFVFAADRHPTGRDSLQGAGFIDGVVFVGGGYGFGRFQGPRKSDPVGDHR